MRRLIRGDLKRILRKISIIIIFILIFLYVFVRVSLEYAVYRLVSHRAFYSKSFNITLAILPFFIYTVIYSDDFKSMSYVTAIGRGISRTKIILAKLCDIVILTIVFYGIIAVTMSAFLKFMGCEFNHTLATAWCMSFVTSIYKTIGYIALASMILYITNNIPISTIVLIILYVVVPFSGQILSFNKTLRALHLERFHYAGLADNAMTDFMYGSDTVGIIKMLAGLIIYMGTVLLVTGVLFDKKELEF